MRDSYINPIIFHCNFNDKTTTHSLSPHRFTPVSHHSHHDQYTSHVRTPADKELYKQNKQQQQIRVSAVNNTGPLRRLNLNKLAPKGVKVISSLKTQQINPRPIHLGIQNMENISVRQSHVYRTPPKTTRISPLRQPLKQASNRSGKHNSTQVSPSNCRLHYRVYLQNNPNRNSAQFRSSSKSPQVLKTPEKRINAPTETQNCILKSEIGRLLQLLNVKAVQQSKMKPITGLNGQQLSDKHKPNLNSNQYSDEVKCKQEHGGLRVEFVRLEREKKELQQQIEQELAKRLELQQKNDEYKNSWNQAVEQKNLMQMKYNEQRQYIAKLQARLQESKLIQQHLLEEILASKHQTSLFVETIQQLQSKTAHIEAQNKRLQGRVTELEQMMRGKQVVIQQKQQQIVSLLQQKKMQGKNKGILEQQIAKFKQMQNLYKVMQEQLSKFKADNTRLHQQLNMSPHKQLVYDRLIECLSECKNQNKGLRDQLQQLKAKHNVIISENIHKQSKPNSNTTLDQIKLDQLQRREQQWKVSKQSLDIVNRYKRQIINLESRVNYTNYQ